MEATKAINGKINLAFGELHLTDTVLDRFTYYGYSVDNFLDELDAHRNRDTDTPSVYVGTYGKYSRGSIQGAWLDITRFDSYADFVEFCQVLHADESDPELMIQDFENFPKEFYCESVSKEDFDKLLDYIELVRNHDLDAIEDYLEHFCIDELNDFELHYCGNFDSEEEFARHLLESTFDIESKFGEFADYFDYEAYGRDLFINDYHFGSNGNVFNLHN